MTATSTDARTAKPTTLAAVTRTNCWLVTSGARKRPSLEIVPALAHQRTPVSLVFTTKAVNCSFPPEETLGLSGVIEIRGKVFI